MLHCGTPCLPRVEQRRARGVGHRRHSHSLRLLRQQYAQCVAARPQRARRGGCESGTRSGRVAAAVAEMARQTLADVCGGTRCLLPFFVRSVLTHGCCSWRSDRPIDIDADTPPARIGGNGMPVVVAIGPAAGTRRANNKPPPLHCRKTSIGAQ